MSEENKFSRALLLTDITPDSMNKGGPSGLLWHSIDALKSSSIHLEIKLRKTPGGWRGAMSRLGLPGRIESLNAEDFDLLLAYPFHIAFTVPSSLRSRTFVIGPDSPSLLFARFARVTRGLTRLKYRLLCVWFKHREKLLLRQFAGLGVVGTNDRRWLRWHVIPKHVNLQVQQPVTLVHPVLSAVVSQAKSRGQGAVTSIGRKSFVFCGDLSKKYVGGFMHALVTSLEAQSMYADIEPFNIMVVGKSGRWIYELFCKTSLEDRTSWVPWVENYADICDPQRHVHCFPLLAGAGTKNRVLTASAMGVPVIATPIAFENILRSRPPTRYRIAHSSEQFATYMLESLSWNHSVPCATTKSAFVEHQNKLFEESLLLFLSTNLQSSKILPCATLVFRKP